MLVYANHFHLSRGATPERLLAAVARWLSSKAGRRVSWSELAVTGQPFSKNSRIQVVAASDESPQLFNIRFSHRDATVAGRDWSTEIGAEFHADGSGACSVLLETQEISARVTAPIDATRPMIAYELASEDFVSDGTPGREILSLPDSDAAEAFRVSIEAPNRKHPFLIISPTANGEYLVDIESVRRQVIGLADVVVIPAGADTFQIAEALDRQYAAWRGAVNILFPRGSHRADSFVFSFRLMPDDLLAMDSRRRELELFTAITHRTNVRMSLQHVSSRAVRETALRRELTRRVASVTEAKDVAAYEELLRELDESNNGLRQRVEELSNQLLEEQFAREDDRDRADYQIEALKMQLATRPAVVNSGLENEHARAAVLRVFCGEASLADVLVSFGTIFPDRLKILPSAIKSADASGFRSPERAARLLQKLCTDYYREMCEGMGDAVARNVFGDSYAARESEGVENNRRARAARTFEYRGAPIEMFQHLRIGVKDSAVETLRIHFAWDASERCFVIGHCGAHLPFK
jgi:hypothetical protein